MGGGWGWKLNRELIRSGSEISRLDKGNRLVHMAVQLGISAYSVDIGL